ncbi:Metalloenzyme, LuxS/M16 peptidase-like protein [Dunaliella salina]|uniref:Metalloenzyme, LuxS/M16 peptidase-like protein n=1 Tax=Dunaliella salina TaxID=3046 RepID=A0ABQ7H4U7_DUNSA|nr:Metalloenzyme, LuxS/M16 peptidase-like protein [Dunaliella salina]|eukprot:KAF5841882.1 Metalloenzyme, LuxS/M16 peptidase-like protein [Dunaliella salina]
MELGSHRHLRIHPTTPAQPKCLARTHHTPHQQKKPSKGSATACHASRRELLSSASLCGTVSLLLPPNLLLPQRSLALEETSQRPGFQDRVSEFTLSNGLHFIVLSRREAPTVSCHLYADVGAFDEEDGRTGLAHLLEHQAFKGTRRVGGKDWKREGPLLDAQDEVFYALRDAKARYKADGSSAAAAQVKRLQEQLAQLQVQADELVIPNAYGALLQKEGAVGLNASTSQDQTRYFCSLPSNKLELWFALESERFRAPVYRGLYAEKKVIAEERRLRVDDAPLGKYVVWVWKLAQKYWAGWKEPYANTASSPSLQAPQPLMVSANSQQQQQMPGQRGYFSSPSVQATPLMPVSPPTPTVVLPSSHANSSTTISSFVTSSTASRSEASSIGRSLQNAEGLPRPAGWESLGRDERTLRDAAAAGPLTLMGYYRPPMPSREGTLLQVACELLSGSRTSRLVTQLVLPQRLVSASAIASYPGEKHAGLTLATGVPREGSSPEECEKLLKEQLEQLASSAPSQAELRRVQAAQRMSLLGSVQVNAAMASLLTSYHVLTGSWRGLLDELEFVSSASPEDVRMVAERTFHPDNVFVGLVSRK